jgi:hypothetical protein
MSKRCEHCGWDGEAQARLIANALDRLDLMLWNLEVESR